MGNSSLEKEKNVAVVNAIHAHAILVYVVNAEKIVHVRYSSLALESYVDVVSVVQIVNVIHVSAVNVVQIVVVLNQCQDWVKHVDVVNVGQIVNVTLVCAVNVGKLVNVQKMTNKNLKR